MAGTDGGKSSNAFRTIGEASEILGVAQHVLRFWEGKFRQLKPVKRRGRRYYRPEDIELLKRIKFLLYEEGFTIKGVQKFLKQGSSVISEQDVESGQQQAGEELEENIDGKQAESVVPFQSVPHNDREALLTKEALQDVIDDLILVRDELKEALYSKQDIDEAVDEEDSSVVDDNASSFQRAAEFA